MRSWDQALQITWLVFITLAAKDDCNEAAHKVILWAVVEVFEGAPPTPFMLPSALAKPSYSAVTWFPISSWMMGSSEKLQWNDFKENMTISFRELREDREITDVTLACEDEVTRLKLTKSSWRHSVHSSWSSWRRINTPILLYTWGASCQRILWLLWTFVYNGEATVFQDSLDAFLALAEELKLKGLSGSAEAEEKSAKETPRPQGRIDQLMKQEIGEKVFPPQSNCIYPSSYESYNTTVVKLSRCKHSC